MAVIDDLAAIKSVVIFTGWPMRMRASCTSLKLASTQTSESGTTAISGAPALTCWPTCTVRWAIIAIHRRHDLHMRQHKGRGAQLRFGRQHIGIVRDIQAGNAGLRLG